MSQKAYLNHSSRDTATSFCQFILLACEEAAIGLLAKPRPSEEAIVVVWPVGCEPEREHLRVMCC